jgi:hypothetical protein
MRSFLVVLVATVVLALTAVASQASVVTFWYTSPGNYYHCTKTGFIPWYIECTSPGPAQRQYLDQSSQSGAAHELQYLFYPNHAVGGDKTCGPSATYCGLDAPFTYGYTNGTRSSFDNVLGTIDYTTTP